MNTNMNGKDIKRIVLPSDAEYTEAITMSDILSMKLSAIHHGDRDEFWVLVFNEKGVETHRYNCKFIQFIEWLN